MAGGRARALACQVGPGGASGRWGIRLACVRCGVTGGAGGAACRAAGGSGGRVGCVVCSGPGVVDVAWLLGGALGLVGGVLAAVWVLCTGRAGENATWRGRKCIAKRAKKS